MKIMIPCVVGLLMAPVNVRAGDLNVELMRSTFKLANNASTATAFVLSRPAANGNAKPQLILITAAHVVEKMAGDEATLFLRRRESEGAYKKVPLKIAIRKQGKALWTKHPSADVAALSLVAPPEADLPAPSVDLLASDDLLKKHAIHPGDSIRCLGYPHRVEANEAGFPILRAGTIASYPLVPARATKTFLASMNTFEGDSGGPVYISEPSRVAGDIRKGSEVRLILGLVTAQHFLDEEATMIYGKTKIRHRLGVGIVVHAAFIKETIERLPRTP